VGSVCTVTWNHSQSVPQNIPIAQMDSKLQRCGTAAYPRQSELTPRKRDSQAENKRNTGVHTDDAHPRKQEEYCVNVHLWPYAVRMAMDQVNNTPNMQRADRKAPMQADRRYTVYVLDKDMQTNSIFNKCKSQSKVGIYAGRSGTWPWC
jgi:hypothetical protein